MGPNRGGGRNARRGGKGGGAASGGRGPHAKPKTKTGSSSGSKTDEALQAVTLSRENQSMVQSLLQQLGPAGDAQPSGVGVALRADGISDTKFADVDRKVGTISVSVMSHSCAFALLCNNRHSEAAQTVSLCVR